MKNNQKWFGSNPVVWAAEVERRISDCDKILDVGCGAGALSIPLSKKFEVYSLDFSLNMLLQLKTRKDEQERKSGAAAKDIGEYQCNLVLRRRAKHL